LLIVFLSLALGLPAADFVVENDANAPAEPVSGSSNPIQRLSSSHRETEFPALTEAGDVPTAYMLSKYELRGDLRMYEGGGVYPKISLGIFPWLSIGGGFSAGNVVGSGKPTMDSESAKASVKLKLLDDNQSWPGLAVGWDGPAYDTTPLRGLYATLSKEVATTLGWWQLHVGANTWSDWRNPDLRNQGSGYAAITALFRGLALFGEYDNAFQPDGGYANAGFRYCFDPVILGLEFRDLGARHGESSRLLRVAYSGQF
jgi:hypothetical protein